MTDKENLIKREIETNQGLDFDVIYKVYRRVNTRNAKKGKFRVKFRFRYKI